ncbi:extracellular solute-binding protein [Nocardioides cavernae]|uniref:Extracellular solute-binding protein n=1 Tax=Nocardioides cavernae TaxID=1921566 RepID=A0ABR8N6Q2_9ACTN|nr:extracellular solute-binding protein [Nocardioides cavernae]MBD3923803.1 extracellular solute-binding protein [Nocardioides cavernae]MBM7511264.1 cellobiose transport system substrate-binding protein [Nocardioides cavernae]
MKTSKTRRYRLASSALVALTLATTAAACGGGDDDGTTADGVTTITVATFNEFGYEGLIDEWNAANDDIKIEQVKVGTWDDAKANLYTKLAAGSGLSDIEAIEGDAMPAILAEEGAFEDLTDDEVDGRWLPWVEEKTLNADGQMIGYATDIGPEGICYRSDLFEKAGLPTDREEVAGLMGTWDDYFALGEEFIKKVPDTAWYDSSGGLAQAMLNQVENPFETDDNTVEVENDELEAVWADVTGNIEKGLSTKLPQWSDDWTASFQNDGFATMACPGWMLGVVEGNAEGVKGWDIANVFPGGGGNWGGSFLTVPAQGENIEEAKEVAAWLTAPEQQVKAFAAKGTFPSQVEALESGEVTSATNAFFNDAPTGEILAERAQAVTVQPYKGPKYSDILQAFQAAVLRVDDGSQDAAQSWDQFLTDVEALG